MQKYTFISILCEMFFPRSYRLSNEPFQALTSRLFNWKVPPVVKKGQTMATSTHYCDARAAFVTSLAAGASHSNPDIGEMSCSPHPSWRGISSNVETTRLMEQQTFDSRAFPLVKRIVVSILWLANSINNWRYVMSRACHLFGWWCGLPHRLPGNLDIPTPSLTQRHPSVK